MVEVVRGHDWMTCKGEEGRFGPKKHKNRAVGAQFWLEICGQFNFGERGLY